MKNKPKAPPEILKLLDTLTEQFESTLQSNLVGLYLHGSLAMGCFNPHSSDIDFLVVVNTKLTASTKQQIIDFTLALSDQAPAKGLEFSVVLLKHLRHFVYPTPFELHFSNAWKERYQARNVDFERQATDPDLAAHFVITRTRGLCLYGQPIERVFPEISQEYYLDSIMADAEEILQNVAHNPVYSVLNLCRLLAYKQQGLIVSKLEGGDWAVTHLDPRYCPVIAQALREYQSNPFEQETWAADPLESFAIYVRGLF